MIDEPHSLDPRKMRGLSCGILGRMLFEGLTRVNLQDQTEFALIENVEISPDLKKYLFHLKKSFWSNGDPVIASDFVYAWKKALSPDFPSDTAFHLYVIKNGKEAKEGKVSAEEIGVRALGPYDLEVELAYPVPYFLDLLSFPSFFPVNQRVDENDPSWAYHAESYVGNGPFLLKRWKHQDHLELEKSPVYWDAEAVQLSGVKCLMLKEETELQMFEKGELDWAGSPLSTIPIDALKELKKNPQFNQKVILGTSFIRMNTQKEFLSHPDIRKGLAFAISRREITDHVTHGSQTPATGLVPEKFRLHSFPCFNDGAEQEAVQKFEEGLKFLNLDRNSVPTIFLTYRAERRNHLIAQAIQEQWMRVLNIPVQLEALESKVYSSRLSHQEYDLILGSWIADFSDPINFLEVFKSKQGGSNNTSWENKDYSALLDRSYIEADPIRRFTLFAQAEQILMDEMPIIPIYYFNLLYLAQPYVNNVALSSMGIIDLKWAFKGEI